MITATLSSLLLGTPQDIAATGSDEWWDKAWRTGFYKQPASGPCWLGYEGLRSDDSADRRYHGGVDKAVCVYAAEVFTLGEARVQVSQPRQPCWKLARRWRIKDLTAQVERNGLTGWYFRVLQHGYVNAGDALVLTDRLCPEWTLEHCNNVMYRQKDDPAAARALAGCALLAGSWKDELWQRATKP